MKELTNKKAMELLFNFLKRRAAKWLSTKPKNLDFSFDAEADAVALKLANDLDLAIENEHLEIQKLLLARMEILLAEGVMEPEEIITRLPPHATDKEKLRYIIRHKIAGMRFPAEPRVREFRKLH